MRPCRLLITGASGAGTTTLGRAVATRWAVPHADVDDFFWVPTEPPYIDKRPASERLALMNALFLPRRAWVLSGSVMGWGDPLREIFEAVVFLVVDAPMRLRRLERRQRERYGETIRPGGVNEAAHFAFLEWARGYDDDEFEGRSFAKHSLWLDAVLCPVLRLDGNNPTPRLRDAVTSWVDSF